jgi:prepilin-type N-terminal cleavage/methylation domain-containing protein
VSRFRSVSSQRVGGPEAGRCAQAPPVLQVTARARQGLTLIEILVVITLIVVLIGLLLPGIGLVRTKVDRASARQTLSGLQTAFDLYRSEDPRKRYPEVRLDLGIHRDLLEDLDDRRLWSRGGRPLDDEGLLLDPWHQPYRYSLSRPTPAANAQDLEAWNWDPAAGHESRWGSRRDPVTGTAVAGPLPFPYLWSIGRRGKDTDASTWLFKEDGA